MPLFTTHVHSLNPIFSLTSTHLTHRRKSPVAYSFWLWLTFWALMFSSAVCLCLSGESKHSCWSDLITSGSNWWFCPHALELQDPMGVLANLLWTLSTPPRHLRNTNSTGENPNILCVLLKSMPLGLFFMIFLKWRFLSLCMWDTLSEAKERCTSAAIHVGEFDPSRRLL